MWKENRKIIDIVDEKNFQPGLRTGKEIIDGEEFVLRRDLDDKGFGQNKVLFSIQRGRTAKGKLPMQAPRRSLRQGDRSPATENKLQSMVKLPM